MNKHIIPILVILLFIISAVSPMVIGYNVGVQIKEIYDENLDCYHISEISNYKPYDSTIVSTYGDIAPEENINMITTTKSLDGPMNSSWPMYCHDLHHTGQSPHSTADNTGFNKWWYKCDDFIEGSAVIDNNGLIYFGCWNRNLYSLFPNGTFNWKCDIGGVVVSSPSIDEDGIIYVGTYLSSTGLNAINPNGTKRWRYKTNNIFSSPAIGLNSTIYFGDANNNINALYPNGTLRWRYKTGHVVYSSPAIGNDGTVYCGSHDKHLYALYPNNGTLKWKYKTGNWIRTAPCIADDGTIYVVSLDNYLHAVNPNGTLKWKTNVGAGTSPTIGRDGTIYCGYSELHAVNPVNGSVNWKYNVPGNIRGGTPCNSADGTIYLGSGGYNVAMNPDGTEIWREHIGTCEFAPIIGEDETVYIGSSVDEEIRPGAFVATGYLYAFNVLDSNAPSEPEIKGTESGNAETEYEYKFKATSPLDNDVYLWVEWGDGDWTKTGWIGPHSSGEVVSLNHSWKYEDTYTIRARAKDTDNLWGPWGELEVTMPKNKPFNFPLISWLLERFPRMFPIMRQLLGL